MKLSNFLATKSLAEFKIDRVEMTIGEGSGEKIALLYLTEPIPIVEGSMSIGEPGDTEKIKAWDVDVVKMHQSDFDGEGIDINADGTGFVKTDKLRLDVATSGEVWLRSQSFEAFRREKSNERKNERQSGIRAKMDARKAKSTFKGVDPNAEANTGDGKEKPEAVSGGEPKTDAKPAKAGK